MTTIGVDERHQRSKIVTRLLLRLANDARSASADALTLEVRTSNVGAQRLYHAFGFVPAGIRKNYYPEVNEDAIVMWAHEVDTDDYAARLERKADVPRVIAEFLAFKGPAFLEVMIDPDAVVYPMVGPGQSYEEMITGEFIPSSHKVDIKTPGPSEMF